MSIIYERMTQINSADSNRSMTEIDSSRWKTKSLKDMMSDKRIW